MIISRHGILTFGASFLIIILFLVAPSVMARPEIHSIIVTTPNITEPTPVVSATDQKVQVLEARVNSLEKFIDVQSNSYSAAVSRIEFNINVLLTVMTVASILLAIMGFGVVRLWIGQKMEDRLNKLTSDQIEKIVKSEVDKMRQEWEPKFAELYEEYRRTLPGRK